jgi:hypothetical protein
MGEYTTEMKWTDGTIMKIVWRSVKCKDKIHVFDGGQTVCGLASYRHGLYSVDAPISCDRCIAGISPKIIEGMNGSLKVKV